MKWFTKQKRHYAALSTLVALALASSTAFAMPTGGTVTSGSLDGYSGGDLTSGASLIPTKDSIINWDSFSIAKGETLTINTMYGALLNRVTGTDLSSIYGTLTQTGAKMAILVNPNGITVGATGVLDTQNMTLSTLAVSDDDFLGNKQLNWTTPDGKSVAAPVKFEKGATVTETRAYGDTAYESELDFYGGTIEVADDVTFTEYGASPSISLMAMQSITEPADNSGGTEYFAATPENTISFSGKVDGLHTTDEGSFNLVGGKITVQNADIELWQKGVTQTEGVSEHKNGSEADIVALTSATGSGDDGVVTSQPGNDVVIKDSTVKSDDIWIQGSTVAKDNAVISATSDLNINATGDGGTITATIVNGLQEVQETTSMDGQGLISDQDQADTQVTIDNAGAAGVSGVEAALSQGEAQFDSFIQTNVDSGYSSASSALTSGSEVSLGDLAGQVDQNAGMDEGAKLAQAFGMIKAVDDNTNLDEEQKKRLKKTVANNFKSLSQSAKTYLLNLAQSVSQRVH